jgi:hypothetical protein
MNSSRSIPIYEGRAGFYNQLPKNAICAEIGVWDGGNADSIYEICSPLSLFLVDTWVSRVGPGDQKIRTVEEWESMYKRVCYRFHTRPNVTIIREDSLIAANRFPDGFFDWIYIDAGHSFKSCYSDLTVWYPKIKVGGYLAGHDYCTNPTTKTKGFGVKKAVDFFREEHQLEISFLSDVAIATDYAILKTG